MGGLRATKSLSVIAPRPPEALEHDCRFCSAGPKAQEKAAQDAPRFECISDDCGICSVSLEQGGPILPHIGHLIVTFHNRRIHRTSQIQGVMESLARVLESVLHRGLDFVTSYDFRSSCVSMPRLASALGKFHSKNAAHFSQRLKAIALLMPDNLFAAAAKGVAGHFIGECCLPSCPRVICHGEATAEEFFQMVTEDASAPDSSFMSVAEVRETAKAGWAFSSESCVAKLVPYSHQRDMDFATGSRTRMEQARSAPLMHTLDNGDVRVVQSPASDVMLRKQEDSTTIRNAEFKRTKMSNGDLQVEALKFRCPAARLRELIGTHFHIGELTIDADAASSVLKGPVRSSKADIAPQSQPQKSAWCRPQDADLEKISVAVPLLWAETGCFAGVASVLPLMTTLVSLLTDEKAAFQPLRSRD